MKNKILFIITVIVFGVFLNIKAQDSTYARMLRQLEIQEKHIDKIMNSYFDSIEIANNSPCSDSTYQMPHYYLNNWEIVALPKVSESTRCNKELSKEINHDFETHDPVQGMDIQYSSEAGCVPQIFMISPVTTGSLIATGHISCFNVSVVAYGKNRYFFNQHIDVPRVRNNTSLEKLYKKTLHSRLVALKDSSRKDSIEIIIGASNLTDTNDIKLYLESSQYLTESIEKTKLFSYVSIWFCAGPNTVSVPIDTIFKYGGIDEFTTDIIIIPNLNKIYVSRPINPVIFNEPFEEAKKQMEKYRDYFSKNTPQYVKKLSSIN